MPETEMKQNIWRENDISWHMDVYNVIYFIVYLTDVWNSWVKYRVENTNSDT